MNESPIQGVSTQSSSHSEIPSLYRSQGANTLENQMQLHGGISMTTQGNLPSTPIRLEGLNSKQVVDAKSMYGPIEYQTEIKNLRRELERALKKISDLETELTQLKNKNANKSKFESLTKSEEKDIVNRETAWLTRRFKKRKVLKSPEIAGGAETPFSRFLQQVCFQILALEFYHCKPDRIKKMAQTSNESDSFELNADTYEVIKRSAAFKKLTIKRGQLRDELTRFFNLTQKKKLLLSSNHERVQYNTQRKRFGLSRPAAVVIESNPSQQLTAKLPLLTLPEFSGSYHDWQQFHDSFQALIHNKTSLANVEKFYYLLGTLKEEPAALISSIPISNDNYPIAWKALKERYEDKKIIINSHIDEIYNLPQLYKESHTAIRTFYNIISKNYRLLEALQVPVKHWDRILIYLSVIKFDPCTKREWENHSKDMNAPTFDEFIKFLAQRCKILESSAKHSDSRPNYAKKNNSKTFLCSSINNKPMQSPKHKDTHCPFYKSVHTIYHCEKFKNLSVKARYDEILRLKLCLNCLRFGHTNADCKSSGCKTCGKRHNTLLHRDSQKSAASQTNRETHGQQTNSAEQISQINNHISLSQNLLHPRNRFNVPSGVPLADPNFYLSSAIDMLIGCDLFFKLLLGGQIRLGKNMPLMQTTLLGWIVSGSISRVQNNNNSSVNAMQTICLFTCETPIDFELQKFWAMEEIIPSCDTFLTKEELVCEAHFAKTITQTSTGRFVVKLPLKPTYTQLGTTEEVAISRLLAMERKFLKDSNMKTEYTAFMFEYEKQYLELRSNDDSERLTDSMSSDDLQYTITDSASIKTLGVSWIPSTDQFEYNAHNMHAYENVKATKRSILSFIAKIFDPLVAYCLRFIKKMKALLKVRVQDSNKTNENYTPDDSTETNYLTINEVEAAEIALLKIAQIQAFPNELCCLQRNQEVVPSNNLKSLAPFLDSSGIMRVGGRLIHSNLSYDQKHQIIISYSHPLTTNRYQHLQYLRQQFWAKWSFDYLHNLQQRTKWQFSHNADLTVGAIVLLKEDNIPPMHWRLGRITAIHPGKDGVVRVVSVRTKTGVTKRALSKVCLLPTEEVQISDR
ncbi:hypothetical protein ILUMI_02997 [Ignelater luminosus]|uniref:DUF5641 domain-containing protein n=1 Tax=Ignelater luminosus TaxID=2038154 RepID=A0A8K0GFY8_IGNLU|nr:hypothetical protein ILUMI_02997 [Ignelater luminosus]